ncbi:GNAT family N-acetyltransferase [Enterococcus sp. LJL99]
MLETERLIVREIKENSCDMQALYKILSDEEVNTYLPWFPIKTIAETEDFYKTKIKHYKEQNGYYFVICLKENDTPIGYISINGTASHDFGYGLLRKFWNQGITTEACLPVIHFLKNQGWTYLTATHDIYNQASGLVMTKLGFNYQYSYKEQWQPKNKLVTFRLYQMNLDKNKNRIYMDYWNTYPDHFIESL